MALFFIEAVRFDDSGERVAQVRWGRSKGGEVMPPAMVADPEDVDVDAVLEAIASGDEVIIKFNRDGVTVLGPQVVSVTYADGSQGLDTAAFELPGHGLPDMPVF
ncbi:MAG: hypothetical protein KGM99_04760 [Burkholderiales bacterium]|nr:hypothetical protein [Burkholderiales bacterium]